MAESVKLLVDDVLGGYPIRQWVLSLPIPLRLLLARYPKELSKVMQIIHRAISTGIVQKAGFSNQQAKTGAGASVSYRIAIGPNLGQKIFTLQTAPQSNENEFGQLAKTAGSSLSASWQH